MGEQISQSFKELVDLKFQVYNGLFLTLPFDAIEQTGMLLPLFHNSCTRLLAEGKTPVEIVNRFFAEHKPNFSEKEQVDFLFTIIQYVERQIVLIDALEDAAYDKIHSTGRADSLERLLNHAKAAGREADLDSVLANFGIRVVLTAHPTQFYPDRVLSIISDLTDVIKKDELALTRNYLKQLGKTQFFRKQKPTAFDEAIRLTWYLGNIFYPAVGDILDRIAEHYPKAMDSNHQLVSLGFWPGGDRDGNPFVTVDTTRKVAERLRYTITNCYYQDVTKLKRRLSFGGIYDKLEDLERMLLEDLTNIRGQRKVTQNVLLAELIELENTLIAKHDGLFLDILRSFRRKVQHFGFHFASIDIRQDSRVIGKSFDAVVDRFPNLLPSGFDSLPMDRKVSLLLNVNGSVDPSLFDDPLVRDTLESFRVVREIQDTNGQLGVHRYIISNCRGPEDMAKVFAMARLCAWGSESLSLDVVPLFETIDDLRLAGDSMQLVYADPDYKKHLIYRKKHQAVMLGFSDGTKDGGYLMANWSIYQAKEDITIISRQNDVEVVFFDGRGGPPARGGGNTHMFYSAMGRNVENKQIQMTVQGQTISSHYGTRLSAAHNLTHLLTAGLENNYHVDSDRTLSPGQRQLLQSMAQCSYQKYEAFKNHPQFIPFLKEQSTLKYYGMTNIGSRPTARSKSDELKFDDLRAIPFVGAWSQLKQNVPGFFGLGSALKAQLEMGNWDACVDLYKNSLFFKALIANSMQSMSKSNFDITRYMASDPVFGQFWHLIHDEYQLTKSMALKISGMTEMIEDAPRSRLSIQLREKVVLPLLIIQQYALMMIQARKAGAQGEDMALYEKMVVRSLFGNINASRNSV
jgi:phosphoenolpyruvate carboxylase